MDPKIRDRTYDELLVRKKEFLKICNILDQLNIIFFLNSGILLGAIRDNDFIKWDWDIEISVFSDELLPNIDLIINKLKENGLWNEIDPSIDANSALVNLNPIASISIPFTSTAYISKAHKTPAIYLDPTGKLDKEYYANIEVPLLSSKVELFKWFESL